MVNKSIPKAYDLTLKKKVVIVNPKKVVKNGRTMIKGKSKESGVAVSVFIKAKK